MARLSIEQRLKIIMKPEDRAMAYLIFRAFASDLTPEERDEMARTLEETWPERVASDMALRGELTRAKR